MIRLYECTLTITVMIAAESEDEAMNLAEHFGAKELAQTGAEIVDVEEAKSLQDVPLFWRESVPWGDGGDIECARWFSLLEMG